MNPRVEQFRFEQRQVHVGGAFGRAGLAGKAIAQRRFQLRAAEGVAAVHAPQLQRRTNGVGPAAGAHDLLAGGDEGRAHRRRFLAATAAPVALLEVARERAVFCREGQHRRKGQLQRTARPLAQLGVNLEPPVRHNLSRVKQVVRVERGLDLAHRAQQPVAELLGHVFRAGNADAVLAGQRAFELVDQGRHLVRELPELLQVLR